MTYNLHKSLNDATTNTLFLILRMNCYVAYGRLEQITLATTRYISFELWSDDFVIIWTLVLFTSKTFPGIVTWWDVSIIFHSLQWATRYLNPSMPQVNGGVRIRTGYTYNKWSIRYCTPDTWFPSKHIHKVLVLCQIPRTNFKNGLTSWAYKYYKQIFDGKSILQHNEVAFL